MRIALSSYSGYGLWFALRLMAEGHQVDTYLSDPKCANILSGIIPAPYLPPDARGYGRYPDYSKYDLSLFDLTGKARQAEFSAGICPTIGDGAFQCACEDDRDFGMEIMEECGILVPPYEKFTDTNAAKVLIKKTGKRYVFKPSGGQTQDTDTTYVAYDAEDMLKYIDKVNAKSGGAPFLLQEFITGTEISCEGFFNGDEFFLVNATIEEKKMMNDNKGSATGCAGNLVFTLPPSEAKVYTQGLKKFTPYLRQIGFTGMFDLNSIVTDGGLYGLEITPRFGYDSFATFQQMYAGNLGEMLWQIGTGGIPEQSYRAEFAAGVRVSIPPYPSEFPGKHPQGIPIRGIEEEDYLGTYLYDVECEADEIVTAGVSGFICTPLGAGNTIGEAFDGVNEKLKRLKIPNSQYRTDIEKVTIRRYNELNMGGWI